MWSLSSVFVRLMGLETKAAYPEATSGSNNERHQRRFSRSFVIPQMSTVFLQCLYLVFSGFIPLGSLNVSLGLSPGVSALVVALWLAIGVWFTFNAGRFVAFFGSEKTTLKVSFVLTTLILSVCDHTHVHKKPVGRRLSSRYLEWRSVLPLLSGGVRDSWHNCTWKAIGPGVRRES